MSNMCFPDVGNRIINFKSEKVETNKQLIKNWLNELKPDRIKRINFQEDKSILQAVVTHSMMIKPEPENKLEESAVDEYLPVQNIMFHSAKINALCGPIFKKLFLERFTNILRPNILCMLKKIQRIWNDT